MMSVFKTKALAWWQVGALKASVLCFGLLLGAYWPEVVQSLFWPLLIVLLATGLYVAAIWLKD